MKLATLAGPRHTAEPPRSTAYYYGDLERNKRDLDDLEGIKRSPPEDLERVKRDPLEDLERLKRDPLEDLERFKRDPSEDLERLKRLDDLGEYLESNEIINDRERLRYRQWSLPEYSTPENSRKETYSTAGTFPMPEQKEKEPLLAELEVVGRVPLSQLEGSGGVRRSRSWYLCCPQVEEDASRESSWRYSSLRPVTAPPVGQGRLPLMVASQTSEDITSLRAERDALARALANERQRAAAAARAHDARLAELHGVIAELVRRREDKQARAIPEEEVSDECESTTQPAGELDNDADRSRTEQNSSLSPAELPTPHKEEGEGESGVPCVEVSAEGDASLDLSERGSDACLSANRCCELARVSGGSCEREHGSAEARVYTASPGRSSSRQAKLASRVRLRRAADHASDNDSSDEAWLCAAERVSRAVCAHADRSEAAAGARRDAPLSLCAWRARCARLQADCAVLQAALQHAADTAHRLYSACAVHESRLTCVCGALRAADRALEAYDVLLALAETGGGGPERAAAELVGRQLLRRLEAERNALGQPLLSPGPWMTHTQACAAGPWTPEMESRLRGLAASLKADTVALRQRQPPPAFCSHHEIELDDLPRPAGTFNMADMEAAVCLQEVLTAREARAFARAAAGGEGRGDSDDDTDCKDGKSDSCRRSKRRERHWLHTQASETDL